MDSVKVALRIRPMVSSELEKGCRETIVRVSGQPQVVLNNEPFTYNYVFDANDSQEKVYNDAIVPIIDQLHRGFNVTILAYGQTGSGKTHTMGTAFDGELNENAGVIPRAIHYIFEKVQELEAEYTYEIKCSFLELYQEQLYDLLANKPREQNIVEIREDRNGICIPDLTYEEVHSAHETTDFLMRGSTGRAVASTAMNEHSSRSHAIFTVIVTSVKKDESQALTTAKFHLVDLAGSERSKKTKATGDRFKEGVKINHGLLALGNVISALGSEKNVGFVRYRDSKLTRLLQDSLGGNSITLMIACVSPADYNTAETLSTLRYADRARKIKNKPIVNQDPHAAEINHLKTVIQKLRMELLATKGGSESSLDTLVPGVVASPRKICNDKMYRDLQEKYRNLQQKLQKTLHDVMESEMCVQIAEDAHAKLKSKTDNLKIVAEELANDMENLETSSSSDQMKEHRIKVNRLVEMVISINDEVEKTVSDINEHKHQTALNATDNSDDETELSEEGGAEIEKEADVYNNKQFNIKEQLCRINHELNLKEQLQQRIALNLNKFHTLDSNNDDKFEECQKKIRELEDEKTELLDKLNHVKSNASAKLAEERRKRLQALEHEINDMKNKIKQQSNLLKVREKETQKIQNLSKEIQAMKESKVKLIRTMRQEAENFRQWKLKREKELIQMKTKGRKMENEMVRKEALHTKQRNVLKRKCEEALAINKRLKDALERQSAAQAMRQKQHMAKDNNSRRIEQVIGIAERELEVITSLIDAEQSLEHLMEDRCIINRRITELRANDPSSHEIQQLEEEYEMRNAQIAELQQKVCVADLDARMRALCDCMQNMSEARSVAKQLVNTVCETRREYANRLQEQKVALDEKRAQAQVSEEEYQLATKRIVSMEKEHREKMVAVERTYEEKIALLLSEVHSKTSIKRDVNGENGLDNVEPTSAQRECFQIGNDLFSKMESMREELEFYKQQVADMNAMKEKKITKPKMKAIEELKQQQVELIDLSTTEDENAFSELDQSDDPDWKLDTPAPRRRKRSQLQHRNTKSTQSNNSDASTNMEDTYVTATSQQPVANGLARGLKRKGKGCKCRNKCKNKQCGCRGANMTCSSECQCGNECLNGKQDDTKGDEADDELQGSIVGTNRTYDVDSKENIEKNGEPLPEKRTKTVNEMHFLKPADPEISPPRTEYMDEKTRKMARLTTINFNTPTSKKKFFD